MTVFQDRTGAEEQGLDLWPPVIVRKADIEAEIDRLAAAPAPVNGRRRSLIVHPRSQGPGPGLAPGIQVALEVLMPGERTKPIRHNSSTVSFCIAGRGETVIDGEVMAFERYDAWYTPSLATYVNANDGDDVVVRLVYSNAALLEKLNIHFVDENPPEMPVRRPSDGQGEELAAPDDDSDVMALSDGRAHLMTYEKLVNPDVVEHRPLRWPWREVKAELDKLQALGSEYRGRRLYLLFNPATGRTNGTTNSFFATITVRPPNIVDRPHRHTSAAINYFFSGSGHSIVGGRRYDWSAGDLMLSAPGWAIHHHASDDAPVYELTVQDSPLHLAMDSLMWQEDLEEKPVLLGSHRGFRTNRSDVGDGGDRS